MSTSTIIVELGERAYPVVVGEGASAGIGELIPGDIGRVAIVTQPNIAVDVDPGLEHLHREHRVFTIGAGEPAKTLATVEDLCRQWAQWGLTRRDLVLAVGGGVVTDVAGFAASAYHRGTRVGFVSTTLLGQIDAAIGGKTGVNLPEGKNLVGAFWQPTFVICDSDHLATLPDSEWRCGYGEVAKYQFLGSGDLRNAPLADQVLACVRLKADVVARDEREGGLRAILNYGHTLAHALEIDGGFGLAHGEAVGTGLIFAAHLAHRLGRIDAARVAEHYDVVKHYGLPETLPASADPAELVALFARDKKAITGLTFVLDGADGVEQVQVDDLTVLAECMELMR